jgi:hypothetical protein
VKSPAPTAAPVAGLLIEPATLEPAAQPEPSTAVEAELPPAEALATEAAPDGVSGEEIVTDG